MTAADDWRASEDAWGSSEPEPEPWASGSWSLERRGDEVADIRHGGVLVLRSIKAVARDRDWGTIPTTVAATRGDGSRLEIDLEMRGHGAHISAVLAISVGDGLHVELDAAVHEDFERNRLGLVVLHPPNVSGLPLRVVHPDGTITDTQFPEAIAPHQPALDIAGLEWTGNGVASMLAFHGEVFEMEDQRNWTDASFKTYSTPLAEPFPVLLTAGTRVHQALELLCAPSDDAPTAPHPAFTLRPHGRVPDITVGLSSAPGTPPDLDVPAAGLLVEVNATAPNLAAAVDRALDAGLLLDLRIIAASAVEIEAVLDLVPAHRLMRLGVFSPQSHITEPELWEALVAIGARLGLGAELVAGTRGHFTELNRTQDRLPAGSALTFSITPQMHARERAQLVESIPIQAIVAREADRIASGCNVHVGPITLRPRFNAVATTPPPAEADDLERGFGPALLADADDERQQSRALAAWTVASFSALSSASVASISYFEQWGPRGLATASGEPYPVLDAIRRLHALRGQTLLASSTLDPEIQVFGAVGDEGTTVIGANLGPRPRTVQVEWPGGQAALHLPAYEITQIGGVSL